VARRHYQSEAVIASYYFEILEEHRHGYDSQAVDASEDEVRSREIGRIALLVFKYDATAVLETAP